MEKHDDIVDTVQQLYVESDARVFALLNAIAALVMEHGTES